MMRFWRSRHRVVRWLLSSLGLFVLLLGLGGGYLSYRLHTISVADIQRRHSVSSAGPTDSVGGSDASLPSFLADSVDKANAFASKPIQAQDALDVAAILLQSGLSLEQIASLTGKVDHPLSNEEKQHIRDLLLSKLSKEEIAALRSITASYGKGLLILDPTYPIELVGVYDEAERARIQKELDARKANSPAPTPVPETTGSISKEQASPTAPISTPAAVPPSTPEPSVSPTPAVTAADSGPAASPSAASPALTDSVLAPYHDRLTQLQGDCETDANQLLSQIKQALSDTKGQSKALSDVEVRYLTEVGQAEQRCNQRFDTLMGEAKQALQQKGLDPSVLDGWRQSYEARKDELRLRAISELSAQLNSTP